MPKEPRNPDAKQRNKSREELKEKLRRKVMEGEDEVWEAIDEHADKLYGIDPDGAREKALQDAILALIDLLRKKG